MSIYIHWIYSNFGVKTQKNEAKNDSFTNNKIECYAWDAETIDSSKSFQSLQSRSIAIETKKIEMAFVLVFRHFIIILTFFFFRDFEDDTEVIDSIFYYISELKQRG